jgi:hypothetical protein
MARRVLDIGVLRGDLVSGHRPAAYPSRAGCRTAGNARDDDEIWIHDRAVDTEAGYVHGNKAGIPNKLRKVSWFACRLSVRREGVADGDPKAFSCDRDIAAHDGGELEWVRTDARCSRCRLVALCSASLAIDPSNVTNRSPCRVASAMSTSTPR